MSITCSAQGTGTSMRTRYAYLDGMRGLSALMVVFSHCGEQTGACPAVRTLLGRLPVVVFIVLSGYCLSLPLSKSPDRLFDGGLWEFIRRRALRILPPYYAALGLSALLMALVPGMPRLAGVPVAHLLIVHQWYPAWEPHWEWNLNPPLWTVGTEWQIYFIFALAIVPIWRRFGSERAVMATIAVGFILQFAAASLLPISAVNGPCPWFVGLFGWD